MLYDPEKGLMKNGSLTAKVYFLLLKSPLTVSELSRIIYNGKVQLAHINRIIDKLSKAGYIREHHLSREEKREQSIDLRTRYWKADYKPLIEYTEKAVSDRKKDSPSTKKEELTENDKKIFNLILNSKWFSKFYEDEFLRTQKGEINIHNKVILSDTPIRFFAFMLEELFSIRMTLQRFIKFKINEEDIFKSEDFDKYVEEHKSNIDQNTKSSIDKAIKRAKKNLGSYGDTSKAIDYYLRDYALLLIPYGLAEKLSTIGRVPLTVFLAFKNATES